MNPQEGEGFSDYDAELIEIIREFRDGLTERLEGLRTALRTLAKGFDPGAAESFYRTAHSLKGTAPSFGAHELVGNATALAELGFHWQKAGSTTADDIAVASGELEELQAAVEAYVRRID